jgi:aconitase B
MVNSKLIQMALEMDYRRTVITRWQQKISASSLVGTMADYDPATGQQRLSLPGGGVIRAKSITNSGIRLGDVVPAVSRTATGQSFLDSRG